MADLEKQGVQMSAEGVDKYLSDLDRGNAATLKSQKIISDSAKSVNDLLSAAERNAGFPSLTSGLQGVATSAESLIPILGSVGGAGSGAAAAISAGMAAAAAAISGIIAIAGAAASAIAAVGSAINQAVALGGQLSKIQNATGASASAAGGIFAAAKITGTPIDAVTSSLQGLDQRLDSLGNKSTAAFGKMSDATDKANKAISRLNEDYARTVAEINSSATDRIAEINQNLAESYAEMIAKQKESETNFLRERDEARAASAQRITDIESAASERIAGLNERLSRLDADNAREREKARQDLADNIAEIEGDLAKRIASLDDGATTDRNRANENGAKQQASIEEDLQKQLLAIGQKYTSQRQSLQDKIYDPSTNPILRNYYKTQIGTLNKLQSAEESAARDGASAKEKAAKRETEALLAEIQTRLDKEKKLAQDAAAEDIAKRRKDASERAADRQREYDQQRGDLTAQIAKENAQRDAQVARERASLATREADLQRSFDKQTAQAQASYDKQVTQAAEAQLKIQAETTKRLDAEKRQYDRQLEDINASLQNSLTGGAAGAAAAVDPLVTALKTLGISAEDFAKLDTPGKIELIGKKVQELIGQGKLQEARDLLGQIFGPTQAAQLFDFYKQAAELQDGVFTQKNIDDVKKYNESLNKVDGAVSSLVSTIGIEFLPIAQEFLDWAIEFWDKHGPAITDALKTAARTITETVIPAMRDVKDWVIKFFDSLSKTYDFIKQNLEIAFGTLATAATNVWEKLKPVRDLVDSIANIALAGLSLNLGIASTAFDTLKKAADDVYKFLDRTFGPFLRDLKDGILADFLSKIGLIKQGFDNFLNLSGRLADFFNGIATSIGRIQLPSWLGGNGASPTFTPAVSFSGQQGRSSFTSPQSYSPPATAGQIAATYSTVSSSNSTNTATIQQNFYGQTEAAKVGDQTTAALFKAGLRVS